MTQYDFDLFVIGAGSGGVRAARIAAGHGASVAIAEADRFGGTCVIRGCVPKKLLVYASRFRDEFEDAGGFGWSVPQPVFDWPSLIAAKDKEIARLEGIYRSNLEKAGVTVFAARAEFAGPNSVTVAGTPSQVVTAERILIATGGSPNLGDAIPGDEFVITSNEAFHLPQMPTPHPHFRAAATSQSSSPGSSTALALKPRWSTAATRSCADSRRTCAMG